MGETCQHPPHWTWTSLLCGWWKTSAHAMLRLINHRKTGACLQVHDSAGGGKTNDRTNRPESIVVVQQESRWDNSSVLRYSSHYCSQTLQTRGLRRTFSERWAELCGSLYVLLWDCVDSRLFFLPLQLSLVNYGACWGTEGKVVYYYYYFITATTAAIIIIITHYTIQKPILSHIWIYLF